MGFTQDQFTAIISRSRRDVTARVARSVFDAASRGYCLAMYVRNTLYDHRLLRTRRVNAAVLSIGNLTTGGTGKTPLVVWLCRFLMERRLRCAILTRGYKTLSAELSDEPAVLAAQCPDVPVIINPDRVAGANEAIRSHGARALIMDDGFQHRRLARDLDIVTIDATLPFGYGRVLPAGLLREPVAGLQRAHAVVLTRCDQVSDDALLQIEETIRRINRELIVVRSIHAPTDLRAAPGTRIDLHEIRDRKVFAFCGLGNPQAFFRTIEDLGGELVGSRTFDDHYRYTTDDLRQIRTEARQHGARLALTTQKDWTKIMRLSIPRDHPPVAYLAVELQITKGADSLTALIDGVVAGKIPSL